MSAWNLAKVFTLQFVNEGDNVLVIYDGKARRATVVCAAGDRARVRGPGFDVWRHVGDLARLRIEVTP